MSNRGRVRLTRATTSTITSSSVTVVADVARPEDAVEQPEGYPVGTVFAIGRTPVKQPSLHGAWASLLPGFGDGLSTTVGVNVVPEERRLDVLVLSLSIEEIASIGLQSAVHSNRLILVSWLAWG